MRTIIRAAIAVVTIIAITNFIDKPDNLSTLERYKDQVVYSDSVQSFLNSKPIEHVQNLELSDVLPSDFF
ncbi:hypothetical protein DOS70_08130 [Staphylococcus felis]|uniref:Uncharacterized protein n=1 Tax=Staphylococcus felis TaxID=46127 RepID=A0AAX1RX24_9STAP|nr:hypothetical protein [Staphylococcus felis]REH76573.1 hypothetical protein DOS60_07440 [Staphylococcus felis]REH78192.1 hypothetical protein DOS57_05520 [Staphylococcus felis]REH78775.1 hypothetical protein DOS59_04675 [Staphylococcus felis]REH82606.1 hypothetical protein DOS63_09845 [Staphylococcus felis]REH83138.1 hypothetical protein DOS56_06660 [Staphylococcus felis]